MTMDQDRSFVRNFSLNVARLKDGHHVEKFEIDSDFFAHFESSNIQSGQVEATLDIHKYATHLDVTFKLKGEVSLDCDRCGKPFMYPLDSEHRVIFSFSEDMDFEGYEVMYHNPQESFLNLVQELYDFIHISIPIRKVPDCDFATCAPELFKLFVDEHTEKPSGEHDPRWDALKKLRDQMDES
ncbi:DUF177 domain-containing protein [Pontibacter sp. G13]|uniref:YceD family protein n=1 Tax=Pontibacter sp. G13 TaxID=3074898 RepID=UPI00288ABDA5|nr:DUF177 domain-containing protein [Pontibacter sp. G13]WNJ21455.1 DUF177 domain-containing protein [Pontibacter sp. G13]